MSEQKELLVAISAGPHNRDAGLMYEDELLALGFATEWTIEPEEYSDETTQLRLPEYARWIRDTLKENPTLLAERAELISRADVVLGVNFVTWQEKIQNFLDPLVEHDLALAGMRRTLPVISEDYPHILHRSGSIALEDIIRDAHLNALGTRRALGDMNVLPTLIREHEARRGQA